MVDTEISDLDEEIRLELQKFEQIFEDEFMRYGGSMNNDIQESTEDNHSDPVAASERSRYRGSPDRHNQPGSSSPFALHSAAELSIPEGSSSLKKPRGRQRLSYSAYEYAEAEGEKEELADKLNSLTQKIEEYKSNVDILNQLNMDLQYENQRLISENEHLKLQLSGKHYRRTNTGDLEIKKDDYDQHISQASHLFQYNQLHNSITISPATKALEMLLEESRARLAQSQQAFRDMCLLKDRALEELENERAMRFHVEKERDAFSAAYEASLQHFEKWNRVRNKT